jgi:WD40-like Beta Propeller Repeat
MKKPVVGTIFVVVVLLQIDPITSAGQEPKLKAVNLGEVNAKADEEDPFLTPDGLTLYYASNGNPAGAFDILKSQRKSASLPWPPGKRLMLNAKDVDARSPCFWHGTLYFASNRVEEEFKDKKNFDLMQMKGSQAPLPLLGVSEKQDELDPWVTPKGSTLYFSRKMEDGWRVFEALGPVPGPIGKAKAVDLPVGFHHATVSGSGLVMYLQGPLPKDRWGLFRTTRAKAGAPWSRPEPLTELNHADGPRGDMSPCLSADGKKLYFASDRPGGKGGLDLWVVPTVQLGAKRN